MGSNKFIAKDLKEKGIAWKIEYIRHEYPFNPRSKQRIMYRAIPSWFFAIQGQKPLMLKKTRISIGSQAPETRPIRQKYRASPRLEPEPRPFLGNRLPGLEGRPGQMKVIGSYAELKELSGVGAGGLSPPVGG